MSRTAILFDRAVCAVLGVALVVLGVGLALWETGHFTVIDTPASFHALSGLDARSWWPWALTGGGLVLLVLGLRWLVAHVRPAAVRQLALDGSTDDFKLIVQADALAGAAADELSKVEGVRAVHSAAVRDRGQRVIKLDVKVEPTVRLTSIGAACDEVAGDLRTALGRDDVYCRFDVSVAGRGRALPRVD